MCLSSDKLYFLCCLLIIVHGSNFFDDAETWHAYIITTCRLNCDHNLKIDSDQFDYCNHSCQIGQCKTGCDLYSYAIADYPCSATCTHWINQNISEAEQDSSITQTRRQSCIQGCSFGLDQYYHDIVPFAGLQLPGPSVVKDSITHNSVELEWEGERDFGNFAAIPFILQKRVVDTHTEWQVHNVTERTADSINVTDLDPYMTYQFRLMFTITTEHFLETESSAAVTTLPFGAPSSAPTITSLLAPSATVISVSWRPPFYINMPLVNYHLSLHPVDTDDDAHVIDTDVSPNVTSWIFGQLLAGQTYEVRVAAVNVEGEGPAHTKTITMPMPEHLDADEIPWLVLGAENMVVKQSLLELNRQSERVAKRPDSITGVGVHVRGDQILVSDNTSSVTLINVADGEEFPDIYQMLSSPVAIDIDWLNNHSYVVDGHRIYRCSIKPRWNQCKIVIDIAPLRPNEVKVDPVNGYLYYTLTDTKQGLFRLDLASATTTTEPTPTRLISADLSTFIIDHEHLQLYFPNNDRNTMMSAFLDGTGVTDMRQGTVARPHFTNIESIVIYDERFFWTNGTNVFSEDYDVGNRTYYHNYLLLFERHFRDINMFYPRAQPIPAPVNPPSNLQVLFTVSKAFINWEAPEKLSFQGEGAFNKWEYEVKLEEAGGGTATVVTATTSRTRHLLLPDLVPNTSYMVKVRALSASGTGPWSEVFYGKTLEEEMESAKLIVAMQKQHQYKTWDIVEVDMDGGTVHEIVQTSPLYPGVTDLAWHEDKLFWTTDDEDVFMYPVDGSFEKLDFAKKAACVAYDWLGERIYWSGFKDSRIRRADVFGNNIEFVFQSFFVRDMALDSVQGRLYWVTMTTVETTTLNGKDHMQYFAFPEICCQHVISVAINADLGVLYWYVQRYEDQALYVADLYRNHGNPADVINSVQLVGTFSNIEKYSALQYISDHLFWLSREGDITVGNTECNYTSPMSGLGSPVTTFAIKHPSLHAYPDGLNSSTINVIPSTIPPQSIGCQGTWSDFNVTWQPATDVNHGNVTYELVIEAEGMPNVILVLEDWWYNIQGLEPYTPLTVQVRGFTYWGSGPVTTTTIKSPMAAPTKPQDPKVYVNQRKNAALSKLTLAADFRWTEPETINGILSQQNVYYWQSVNPNRVTSTRLAAAARHFILDGLEGNKTYFFEVECCTPAGCGPRSAIVNATAGSVNPVPKLLLAMTDSIQMAEAENVQNTSVTIATKSVVAMSYLAQESTHFWITKDNDLEKYTAGKSEKLLHLSKESQSMTRRSLYILEGDSESGKILLHLSKESQSMTLDWISRTLYILEGDSESGKIVRYRIDQATSDVVATRDAQLGHIIMDPYTSNLIWSEKVKGDEDWTMVSMNINGQGIYQHFGSDRRRRRRAVGNICNCPPSQRVSAAMTMDLSHDGNTEVIFIDEGTNSLLAADVEGCRCRTLLTTTKTDKKGLPADHMTVDHVYIYWYNRAEKALYTMDKQSRKVASTQVNDVKDILAFGPHLHPLPGSECLDTTPYKEQVDIESYTNTSVKVRLHEVVWPDTCANISHPAVKYTVYYRMFDQMNPKDNCRTAPQFCLKKEVYTREITLDNLEPYMYYVIHGAVSNYYNVYSASSLGEATIIRTRPGVPSPIANITAVPQNPNNVAVSWPPPAEPNGPLDKIVYHVRWSTQSGDGISHALKSDAITHDAMNPYSPGEFKEEIGSLMPDQTYSIQVISNQTVGGYVTESAPVKVHTYQEPNSLSLVDVTNTSIELSWQSPSDNSVNIFSIYYAQVSPGLPVDYSTLLPTGPIITSNSTVYNKTFTDLKPNTEYTFRLNIIYQYTFDIYYWPQEDIDLEFTYTTLTGIPGQPDPPTMEEFKSGEFEVSWSAPEDHGEKLVHYILQYRPIDKENWTYAYNTTELRWVVDDGVLQRGYTYVFRVMAENKNGWGPYSLNSSMFSYPILEAETGDGMVTVVAVVCAFAFVVIAMVMIGICFSVCRKRQDEKKKTSEFIAVARGPDLELATLRELPLTAVQQNNALYALSLVPTDDEIAALPHFRRDQLVLCKFLGSGAFGEVFEGVAKNILNESSGDTSCAVKTLRKSASDQEKEEFLKEALLMSNFRHEHILSLLGVCLDNDPQFIILELMEGGDLLSFMRACRLSSIQNKAELSLTDLVKVCVHVSRGCKYLEDMHFVHRDLAARNCLVSSLNPATMVVKIGDFGLARDIYKNDYYRKEGEGLLPVRWMSPESLVDGVFTTQSDIWAFGVLMWEVFTFGQQPYPARTNIEVLHYVRSAGLLDRPDNCPDDFYQLMRKCWSFAPEDRPSFAFLLQQLEKFQETCASLAEYLVPIRSNNGPIATVDGYKYLSQRSRRLRSTSSDGPEYTGINHSGYGSHKSYGKIRRATSFDAPEPKDATQQITTDSSNYLEPKSHRSPPYMEFLPDSRTENYVYNANGERMKQLEKKSDDPHSTPKYPIYVQTEVKENLYPNSAEYIKYIQNSARPVIEEENDQELYKRISHQESSADSVIMKTVENIPSACKQNADRPDDAKSTCSDRTKMSDNNSTYAQVMSIKRSNHFRKHRLDSSNSIMSFDSVQTEPAYCPEFQNHRNKLYSSSSSKSNYSMSNISESIAEHMDVQPEIDNECQQFWANNANDSTLTLKGQTEVKGHTGLGHRAQVYPENMGPLAGYDIVQASLV